MGESKQQEKNMIQLKGSAQLVSEFFFYGINSILYQRGIYPEDSFTKKQQYGLTVLVTKDEKVKEYLANVLAQIKDWLEEGLVKRLVLVIGNADTTETLERWEFQIQPEEGFRRNDSERETKMAEKDLKIIQKEMRDVIKQITASVTFLPLLDINCSFNLLVYTSKDCEASSKWADTSACLIPNAETLKLKSFATSVHKVEAGVSYKMGDS